MLVLSRKPKERIVVDIGNGQVVELLVVAIGRNRVRIGVVAPRSVPILRGELVAEGGSHAN